MNAKKQFLYSTVPARECWIDCERGQHYKIKTEILPNSQQSTVNSQQLTIN
jgi:hypothetical protein